MVIDQNIREEMERMPQRLREILEAELAAGNDIAEVRTGFPAAPVGVSFLLARPMSHRPPERGAAVTYYNRNGSTYSGEVTDESRHFFILEPPLPPEPQPTMEEIRAQLQTVSTPILPSPPRSSQPSPTTPTAALRRFESSMAIDYSSWREGIGYDLDAIRDASPEERLQIETVLLNQEIGWRDVEALATLNTPNAVGALKKAAKSGDPEVQTAVMQYAPGLFSDSEKIDALVDALRTAAAFYGLSSTLDEVEDFHPPEVIAELLRGAAHRDGETAVHYAAMLYFLYGIAAEAFDWDHRPFFLRFNTSDASEREAVFRELCANIGVDPAPFLRP